MHKISFKYLTVTLPKLSHIFNGVHFFYANENVSFYNRKEALPPQKVWHSLFFRYSLNMCKFLSTL